MMNKLFSAILFSLVLAGCNISGKNSKTLLHTVPADILGDCKDDYDITYAITDKLWIQHPDMKYQLLKYDSAGQFFIAKNDNRNTDEAGL